MSEAKSEIFVVRVFLEKIKIFKLKTLVNTNEFYTIFVYHFQVNYRPPSNMGIAIPLTDNFYHADPSQPIPRNLFHKSKVNIFSCK